MLKFYFQDISPPRANEPGFVMGKEGRACIGAVYFRPRAAFLFSTSRHVPHCHARYSYAVAPAIRQRRDAFCATVVHLKANGPRDIRVMVIEEKSEDILEVLRIFIFRARWCSGSHSDSYRERPGFDSRSCYPSFGFLRFPETTLDCRMSCADWIHVKLRYNPALNLGSDFPAFSVWRRIVAMRHLMCVPVSPLAFARSCAMSPVSLLASQQGGPGSIPGRVTPGFSHVGIVPDDAAAGRRVFPGISRSPVLSFRRCSILISITPSSALMTSLCLARQGWKGTKRTKIVHATKDSRRLVRKRVATKRKAYTSVRSLGRIGVKALDVCISAILNPSLAAMLRKWKIYPCRCAPQGREDNL
ncbi:hypothetical protein PR048_021516 [Dryococelus australis]|uniref:Uncharacterized protein n=1 Tax=Dryococelus australis TaxID=614101 RepID=A0ABQ9GYG7_9NEOP|nr:hypothetical protein PR048_021516 [Dryococelus australis]